MLKTANWLVGVVAAATALSHLHAQKGPAFDVVSIVQRHALDPGGSIRFQPGGRFQATNVFVLALIATAYNDGSPLLPDIKLQWTADALPQGRTDPDIQPLATALKEQLGLPS